MHTTKKVAQGLHVLTGTHEPQPAPQDPDKAPIASHTLSAVPKSATHSQPSAVTVAETVTLTEAAAAHSTRNAPPRSEDALTRAGQAPHPESPRPSQPPADDFAHGESLQDSAKAAGTAEQHSTAGQQRSQATSADAGAKYEALQLLREHVVRVTEAAACLTGLDSDEAECEQVMLLCTWAACTVLLADMVLVLVVCVPVQPDRYCRQD